jgi:cyclic di-GMP phosphodiesterase Gmr
MAAPPESASPQPAADATASELELLTATFDGAGVSLVLLDGEGRVLRLNAACVQQVAHAVPEWAELPVWQVLPGEDAEAVRGHFGTLEQGRTPGPFEQLWVSSLGNRHRIVWSYSAVRDQGGGIRYLVGTGIDVTEHRKAEAAWQQRAQTDPLTGQGNRIAFETALAAHLDPDRGLGCGLLFCDLDAFKLVNDTHGHAVGDELLIEVARRLTASVRDGDLVARIGGDEFVVLMPAVGAIETRAAAARVERSVTRPYRLSVGRVEVGISVGPRVADAGEDPAGVLHDADAAMYAVKARRARVRLLA